MTVELLLDARLELGESPAWEAQTGVLYFVNIPAGEVHFFQPADGTEKVFLMGEPVGCLAPVGEKNLILGMRSGIWSFDLTSEAKKQLCTPEANLPGNRFNDGKCDPAGRFLAGTMDDAEQIASGSLYSLSRQGLNTLLTGLHISNGLTWSPDARTFYFIDTPTRLVMAYDYDLDSGRIANPRPVIHVTQSLGWPDGMTADMEGMLWIAMWAGAQITRWDPATGRMLAAYPVPAWNVSSCIFGGPENQELYITTARKGMPADKLGEYPASGGLFRMPTTTTGLPTFTFKQ